MKKLPKKPSELITLALKDMELSIAQGHRIYMGDWVNRNNKNPKVCSVCLAGSVMLQSLKLTPEFGKEIIPSNDSEADNNDSYVHMQFSKPTYNGLTALNSFRRGKLKIALRELYGYSKADKIMTKLRNRFDEVDEIQYEVDSKAEDHTRFILQMSAIAKMFEVVGY